MGQEVAWQGDPLRHSGPKLFIVDARNGVERRYLLDWLHGTWGNLSDTDWTTLRLSDETRALELDGLAERLGGDDEKLVIPLLTILLFRHPLLSITPSPFAGLLFCPLDLWLQPSLLFQGAAGQTFLHTH